MSLIDTNPVSVNAQNLPQHWLHQAVTYCQAGQWQRALLPLYLLSMDPPQWELHALLANTLNRLGYPELAVSFLEYGLRTAPLNHTLRQAYWPAAAQVLPMAQLIKSARSIQEIITEPTEQQCLKKLLGKGHDRGFSAASKVPASISVTPCRPRSEFYDNTAHNSDVDILIPVFDGYSAMRRCLESVLATRASNSTTFDIIVLDDASPDHQVQHYLKAQASEGKILYHRHAHNLGFISNMNFGMGLHPGRDVLWLNADTQVAGGWVDQLRSVAYSQPKVASVTPWSNNGEWTCFPEKQIVTKMPSITQIQAFNQLLAELQPAPVTIPSGCGFCFYIPRQALNAVGLLNDKDLRRGYAEETEWSLRARDLGWKHLAATNTYVAHEGGVSFGLEKYLRVYQNRHWIKTRYADYDVWYQNHPGAQELAAAADKIQAARIKALNAQQPEGWTLEIRPEFIAEIEPTVIPAVGCITLTYNDLGAELQVNLAASLDPSWTASYCLPRQIAELQALLQHIRCKTINSIEAPDLWPPWLIQSFECLDVAKLVTKAKPYLLPVCKIEDLYGKTWLIADRLEGRPQVLAAWLRIAENIRAHVPTDQAEETAFVLLEGGAHLPQLLATHCVYFLPRLVGLEKKQMVKASDVHAALTCDQSADQTYPANLAKIFQLKLWGLTEQIL